MAGFCDTMKDVSNMAMRDNILDYVIYFVKIRIKIMLQKLIVQSMDSLGSHTLVATRVHNRLATSTFSSKISEASSTTFFKKDMPPEKSGWISLRNIVLMTILLVLGLIWMS